MLDILKKFLAGKTGFKKYKVLYNEFPTLVMCFSSYKINDSDFNVFVNDQMIHQNKNLNENVNNIHIMEKIFTLQSGPCYKLNSKSKLFDSNEENITEKVIHTIDII